MRDQVVVRCKDLRKTYEGKVEAVRGIDLTIYAGQCYDMLRAIILEGSSLSTQVAPLAVICVWGGVCFFFAVRFFRWT